MTVDEWRNKHRRCYFCEHIRLVEPPYDPWSSFYKCVAKEQIVNERVPRLFCRLFKLKED